MKSKTAHAEDCQWATCKKTSEILKARQFREDFVAEATKQQDRIDQKIKDLSQKIKDRSQETKEILRDLRIITKDL